MKQPTQLVFIPTPGIGHIVATIEIAKLLVSRDENLFITVLVIKLPTDNHFTSTDTISNRISFVNLPETSVGTDAGFASFMTTLIQNHKPNVKDAVAKLLAESTQPDSDKPATRLAGFVIDMFCTPMIDVANEFGVPTYLFFTSGAATLGFLLHLQSLRDEEGKDVSELIDSGADMAVPSYVNPLPIKVFPGPLLNKDGATDFINYGKKFRDAKGILVNTFSELESHAIRSLSDGRAPPVYPVGPLLNLKSADASLGSEKSKHKSDVLKWLDDQPPSSVVFLCFGSMGSFKEAQVKEIACALERSEVRFVWSLRQPPLDGKMGMPSDYADPTGVLPEGFLDRTVDIGKVIGWAPQMAILAHPAVGGFVSHCGWNSTLEGLWHGVPVAAWPLYAEQQVNAFQMVKELGLSVEVKIDYRKESEMLVSAQEIESGIRKVMELDSDVRKKVKEMSAKGKRALMEGGSSYSSLGRFIDQI